MLTSIKIPKNIEILVYKNSLNINGKLGMITMNIPEHFSLRFSNNILDIYTQNKIIKGTFISQLKTNLKGVSQGYNLKLQLIGIGYKFLEVNNYLKLKLGYSHKVYCKIPSDISVNILKPTLLSLSGIHFFELNQFAAKLISFKTPEVYKGKGVRHFNDHMRLKETKKK